MNILIELENMLTRLTLIDYKIYVRNDQKDLSMMSVRDRKSLEEGHIFYGTKNHPKY
jgi:hypothetical protein